MLTAALSGSRGALPLLRRVIHEASFALASLPVLLRDALKRPAVIFVIEPSFVNVLVSLFVSRCCGARTWLHIQDFEVDIALGDSSDGSGASGIIRGFESWLLDDSMWSPPSRCR